MLEKRFYAVPPQPLTTNGSANGYVTIYNACNLLKVKQIVNITDTLGNLNTYEVKRIDEPDRVYLGPIGQPLYNYSNLSVYTTINGAFLFADEQQRTKIAEQEIPRAVFQEEPTVAIRSVLVDDCGDTYGESNPLPVEGTLTVSLGGVGADFAFGDYTSSSTAQQAIRRTAYTEQSTNGQRSFASSSASDTGAGTGAQQVTIEYFDQSGNGPFFETVTLNGTTRVNTVATNICYIEEMNVSRVGSGGSNVGTITLFTTPTSGGVAIGTIEPNALQTFWCHHYVPISKTCRVSGISGATDLTSSSYALIYLKAQPIGVTGSVELQVSDSVKLFGGAPTAQRNYSSPIPVVGPAKLVMYCRPGSNSSQNIFASFDFTES